MTGDLLAGPRRIRDVLARARPATTCLAYGGDTSHQRREVTLCPWSRFMRELLDGPYAEAERVVLVMDQLNTHDRPASTRRSSRRIEDKPTMQREVAAWEEARHTAGASVDWRFTTDDARIKLRKLYPSNNA